MSELSSDDASGQPVRSDWSNSGRVHTSDVRTPPNTEEEGDSDYPWRDRMVSRKLCGSSSDALYEEDGRCTYSTVSGVASERYADIAVLSDFSDESEETERTRLADGRGPGTGQPISGRRCPLAGEWMVRPLFREGNQGVSYGRRLPAREFDGVGG